jgi:tetratricopeptide (TPR) repeat protein
MGHIESMMIVDEGLMPAKLVGATLKRKVSGRPMGNSRPGEKPEGVLEKLQTLFRNARGKDQRDLKYYLGLIRKEPENTFARLRIAEIYQKRGEKRKAIFVYLLTAEIFSRKRLFPQAMAIYKRIQKEDPSLLQLYPKIAETCRKMGFLEETSSLHYRAMKENAAKGMRLKVATKCLNIMEELQKEKPRNFPETAKAQEQKGGDGSASNTGEVAFPGQEEEEVCFDLVAQLEYIQPPESEEVTKVTFEKSYGFEEIFKELKRIDEPSNAYPDFNYNMGVACREMGLIDEAIEQFNIALEAGQKPFDAAYLLGLCFLDKDRPQEARRSFQEALKVEGIPKEKIMAVELALNYMKEKKKEGTRAFLEGHT